MIDDRGLCSSLCSSLQELPTSLRSTGGRRNRTCRRWRSRLTTASAPSRTRSSLARATWNPDRPRRTTSKFSRTITRYVWIRDGKRENSRHKRTAGLTSGGLSAHKSPDCNSSFAQILRYAAELDSVVPEDKGRKFIISYRLADDMIYVYEPPIRNSGFKGGEMERLES